ncbi:CapA family protein [bacterium]|nr:CapA family protein [bacterium]MBU1985005.1 CapA family protein [bacterium]
MNCKRASQKIGLTLLLALTATCAVVNAGPRRPPRTPGLDECDSLFAVVIQPEGGTVRLSWYDMPGVSEWIVYRGTRADMSDCEIAAVVSDTCTWRESSTVISERIRLFYWVAARWFGGTPENYSIIADFEEPVALLSYSMDEDLEPSAWHRIVDGGYNPYGYSLELYGNTWKRHPIDTVWLEAGTIWRVAAKAETIGEGQAIGMADSANEMWYGLWGTEVRQLASWNNIYQGWEPAGTWAYFDLPVGEDWMGRFGYYPAVTTLLYANDSDNRRGVFRIDQIRDVTGTISLPPDARFRWRITGYPHPDTMEVAFCSMGCDPEGPLYRHFWSLGDGTFSTQAHPVHRFPARGVFSVALSIRDTSNRVDWIVQEVADTVADASRRITALFGGDVMMARRYEEAGGIIPTRGVNAIFENIRPLVSSVELAMCNLECPLTNATEHHPTKMYYFKGRPEYVEGLTFAGFDYCALANNHTYDYLDSGMFQTMHVLDSVGLLHSGCGETDGIARQPVFFSLNGLSVAIVSFCNRDGSWDNEQPFLGAGPSRPGFAMWNRPNMEQAIPALRDEADVVIVQVHSGFEYATEPPYLSQPDNDRAEWDEVISAVIPDTSDVDLRRYAIDLGADLVVNHHPHVIQGCEFYDGRLIAHSMGNFAFDQYLSETFFTMAIKTQLVGGVGATGFVMHPVFIDRYIPGPARGELGGAIIDYVADLSRPMNTWVMRAPEADTARIIPAGNRASCQRQDYGAELRLENRSGLAISAPFRLEGGGYLTRMSLDSMNMQFRVGRELLWYGNMEDEGATPWDLNSNFERYDTQLVCRGERSLRLNRAGGGNNSVSTNLLNRWPWTAGSYTMSGFARGENTREVRLEVRFWNQRTGGVLVNTQLIGEELSGLFFWKQSWDDVVRPEGGWYYDVRVNLRSPASGEGFAWFDDLALIRWEDWQSGMAELPFPNNLTYVQVRGPEDSESAPISYRREWYYPIDIGGGSPD